MSRDDFSWTCAISWKTTNDAPSNLSLAIAVCSWPELIPAIETGNRSTTMFCIICRYKISIRTQVLQVRVSSKFVHPYLTKPIPRRVCNTQILLDEANTEREEVQDSPSGRRNESKEVIRSGKENDEVTVVLETKTKNYRAIVAYQDLDCWNLL